MAILHTVAVGVLTYVNHGPLLSCLLGGKNDHVVFAGGLDGGGIQTVIFIGNEIGEGTHDTVITTTVTADQGVVSGVAAIITTTRITATILNLIFIFLSPHLISNFLKVS